MGEVVLFESLALIQGLFRGTAVGYDHARSTGNHVALVGAVQRANLDSQSGGERRKVKRHPDVYHSRTLLCAVGPGAVQI